MPSQKNINQVSTIDQNLKNSKSVILADYKGLNVDQMTNLKRQIKESGGEFVIIKNTLLKIALKNNKFDTTQIKFTGPTAILYSYNDEITPLKIMYEFYKNTDLPKIKYGFLQKDFLDEDKVVTLASLPSIDILRAKFVNILNSPKSGLVYALKANLNNLVSVLKQIKDNKN